MYYDEVRIMTLTTYRSTFRGKSLKNTRKHTIFRDYPRLFANESIELGDADCIQRIYI